MAAKWWHEMAIWRLNGEREYLAIMAKMAQLASVSINIGVGVIGEAIEKWRRGEASGEIIGREGGRLNGSEIEGGENRESRRACGMRRKAKASAKA
jgi:hypothetical protein